MTAHDGVWLSPAQTSSRLGVTIKALRLYERHGLVTPQRNAHGWRAYGPDEMARLHQVLALKALGLPLRRIASLLDGRGLEEVLALQERALGVEQDRLARALSLVRAARAKLAGGAALTLDDLTVLARGTTMAASPAAADLDTILAPFIERHFSAADRAALAQRPFDADAVGMAWTALIAEAQQMMELGDPASPGARDLARRWQAQVAQFTGGDPNLLAKAGRVWKDAMAAPEAGRSLPLNPEIFAFIGAAIRALDEQP